MKITVNIYKQERWYYAHIVERGTWLEIYPCYHVAYTIYVNTKYLLKNLPLPMMKLTLQKDNYSPQLLANLLLEILP
jgi:hypothetical protein